MDEFGTLRLDVTIPTQKVMSCAMLIVDEYRLIAEQALEECREELLSDEGYKNAIKDAIKAKLKAKIEKTLTDRASWAAEEAIRKIDMHGIATEILKHYIK